MHIETFTKKIQISLKYSRNTGLFFKNQTHCLKKYIHINIKCQFFFFLFKLRHLSAILCRMFTGSLFQFISLSSSLHSNWEARWAGETQVFNSIS